MSVSFDCRTMSAHSPLLSHFRPHLIYAGLFSFFVNIALLAPPLFMIQVFDRVFASRSQDTLWVLLLGTVMTLLVMLSLDYLRGLMTLAAGATLDRLLGQRTIQRLALLGSGLKRSQQAGGLRDIGILRSFLTGSSIIALFDAPWALFFLLVIFLFHPLLGLIALGGAVLLLCLAWISEKLTRAPLEKLQAGQREAGRFIDAGLRNADALNAMAMTQAFSMRWEAINQPLTTLHVSTHRRLLLIQSASRFLRPLLQVTMLAAGAWLVLQQHVTPGVMIASTIILGRALSPVENLIANWNTLVQARTAHSRLRALLDESDEQERIELPEPAGELSVEKVSLTGSRADQLILRQIHFNLMAGESLAIVGPSASGKSSLARLLCGVWQPSIGHVRLDGADIARADRRFIGRYIGYLPQDVELFPATIAENIARLGAPDDKAVVAAARLARVHDLILRLPEGYDTRIGEGGTVLSGGQMQRVGLARALYGNPKLVVLDEPNANLDAEGELSLTQVFADLKRTGVTLAVITHKPSLLSNIDRILVLREGAMEAFGARAEILSRITGETPVKPVSAGAAKILS